MIKKIVLVLTSSVVVVSNASENQIPSHEVDILSVINQRNYQEDFCCHKEVDGGKWYAVYDGHGGVFAARFLQQNLHTYFSECKKTDMRERMIEAFKTCDEKMIAHFQHEDKTDGMSCQGYCGSTAVVAFIKDGLVHFVHTGDSRAVLVQEGKVVFATTDHKVDNPKELIRMQLDGAHPYIKGINKDTLKGRATIARIEGLAVSRAFGDYEVKNKLQKKCRSSVVIAEPDYTCVKLEPKSKLILASDGLWDVMSNEEVVKIIEEKKDRDIKNSAHFLVTKAIDKKSLDNITVMLVDLLP